MFRQFSSLTRGLLTRLHYALVPVRADRVPTVRLFFVNQIQSVSVTTYVS